MVVVVVVVVVVVAVFVFVVVVVVVVVVVKRSSTRGSAMRETGTAEVRIAASASSRPPANPPAPWHQHQRAPFPTRSPLGALHLQV